jgi:peptidoglycan-associated lipoprotein
MALLAGALALAGCARKKEDLPPPPPPVAPETEQVAPTAPLPPVSTGVVPGSVSDFNQFAGSNTVFFALDSYGLDPDSRFTLDKQAVWLNKYPRVMITIEGHCDERGTREYNLALGERRANAVKNYLVAQGVAANRISVISYGKERPAVEGSTDAAWAQNRRAVTVLVSGFAAG